MPPKVRITEDSILEASIQLLRERGLDAINARDLAERLNCSTQPIFWRFQNMDELKKVLYEKIEKIYNQHMLDGMKNSNSFLGMGLAYINFAKKEKNLFKLLFMSNYIKVKSVFEMIEGEDNKEIIQMISQMTNLQEEKAKQLYINIWLVTHGIAAMLATNSSNFTDSEIETILKDSFSGFSNQLRSK
jgi:AcrR family transcriptional regulator